MNNNSLKIISSTHVAHDSRNVRTISVNIQIHMRIALHIAEFENE